MPGTRNKSDLRVKSIWEEEAVESVLTNRRHRNKMWNWLIQHPDKQIDEIPFRDWSIPREAAAKIIQGFVKYSTTIVQKKESNRADTTKLLVRLQDGHQIETVVMRHANHATVCVSSQIGCQMGCRFCATGTMGIIGDLTTGEILEQLAHANSITKIRNVVFMGMGEPLQNYENVKRAVLFMIDSERYSLSPRQVTVSTVGVIKNMLRLSNDIPHVNLALSLHAPNQEVRLKIVPTATAQKFEKLIEAVDYHIVRSKDYQRGKRQQLSGLDDKIFTKRQKLCCVMIEYILIKDINDRPAHAHELGALLQSRRDYILLNLIPYNPTDVAEDYYPPSDADVEEFSRICQMEPYLIHTRIRQEMGQDIDGACGQLAVATKKSKKVDQVDIEDISMMGVKLIPEEKTVENAESMTSRRLHLLFVSLSIPFIATCLYLARSKHR